MARGEATEEKAVITQRENVIVRIHAYTYCSRPLRLGLAGEGGTQAGGGGEGTHDRRACKTQLSWLTQLAVRFPTRSHDSCTV